jgi:hypothetical protein
MHIDISFPDKVAQVKKVPLSILSLLYTTEDMNLFAEKCHARKSKLFKKDSHFVYSP